MPVFFRHLRAKANRPSVWEQHLARVQSKERTWICVAGQLARICYGETVESVWYTSLEAVPDKVRFFRRVPIRLQLHVPGVFVFQLIGSSRGKLKNFFRRRRSDRR